MSRNDSTSKNNTHGAYSTGGSLPTATLRAFEAARHSASGTTRSIPGGTRDHPISSGTTKPAGGSSERREHIPASISPTLPPYSSASQPASFATYASISPTHIASLEGDIAHDNTTAVPPEPDRFVHIIPVHRGHSVETERREANMYRYYKWTLFKPRDERGGAHTLTLRGCVGQLQGAYFEAELCDNRPPEQIMIKRMFFSCDTEASRQQFETALRLELLIPLTELDHRCLIPVVDGFVLEAGNGSKTIYSMVERPPTALTTPIPDTGVEPLDSDVAAGLGAPGDTLETFINEGRCTPTAAYFVVVQLLEALKALHERGIAHLDIRPATILMWTMIVVTASDGTEVPVPLIKLAEWGRWLPRLPVNALTMDYLGPELFNPAAIGDAKADIFAAGMVFYRMYVDQELRSTPRTFPFTTPSGILPTPTGFPARIEQQAAFRDASGALTPEGKLMFAMTGAAPESRSTAAFILGRYFNAGS